MNIFDPFAPDPKPAAQVQAQDSSGQAPVQIGQPPIQSHQLPTHQPPHQPNMQHPILYDQNQSVGNGQMYHHNNHLQAPPPQTIPHPQPYPQQYQQKATTAPIQNQNFTTLMSTPVNQAAQPPPSSYNNNQNSNHGNYISQDDDSFFGSFSSRSGASQRLSKPVRTLNTISDRLATHFQQNNQQNQLTNVPPPQEFTRSNHSVASSFGSKYTVSSIGTDSLYSAYSDKEDDVNVLHNNKFSPPPKLPASLKEIRSQMDTSRLSQLPRFENIKHSGECLARFSLKSMVIKKWRSTFWIAYGLQEIYFFRSKTDFEEWVSNPYLSKEQRNSLVKMKVDFVRDLDEPFVEGYQVSMMSMKHYKKEGEIYHYKLEKWDKLGPTVSVAIGGKNSIEIKNLRTIMKEMIEAALLSQMQIRSISEDNGISPFDPNGPRGPIYDLGASVHSSASYHSYDRPSEQHRKNQSQQNYVYDLGASVGSNHTPTHQQQQQPMVTYQYPSDTGGEASYVYDLGATSDTKPKPNSMLKEMKGKLRSASFGSESKQPNPDADMRVTDRRSSVMNNVFGRKAKDPNAKVTVNVNQSEPTRSTSRLKGIMRRGSEGDEHSRGANKYGDENQKSSSKLKGILRRKSDKETKPQSIYNEPVQSQGFVSKMKNPKSIFKKKNKPQGQPVQDSGAGNIGYRQAEIDYGF